jgi:hypothetical protein
VATRERPSSVDAVTNAGLLQLRDYIRNSLQSLPPAGVRQLLQAMNDRRGARVPAKPAPFAGLTTAEMHREIAWRLETLPGDDAEALAAMVRRLMERPE